ncbi:nitroreductase family protein [Ruegeria arenilitoris]|uniref:nitroreductase family protein n=1 Tax=Ruegeria arenilitoris TaxID=1173585 RepID=UPI00147C825E|nr:nitroreductase family protein [Ruegeria arenilitoris]
MRPERNPDYPIEPLFLSRWSPRSYDASAMPEPHLLTILEAGRWAPSAFNVQPWRFLYAMRDSAHWSAFGSLLDPFNQNWATDASALVFLVSDTVMPGDENRLDKLSRYNSFDAGAAWVQIALQAAALGYAAHAMAGLNFERVRHVLELPDRFQIEIGIAIGRQADAARLPEDLKAQEVPSGRMTLDQISFPGPFPSRFNTIAAE